MPIVYLLTHKASGKRYVGKTKHTLAVRWYSHVKHARKGSRYAIHAAIRKYGPDAFDRTELDTYATEEAALRAERMWIALLDTVGSNGYNMCLGGRGIVGYRHSADTREYQRQVALAAGQRPGEYAMARSREVRAKGLSDRARSQMSEAQKVRRATEPITDAFRQRMREIALARPPRPAPTAEQLAERRARRLAWKRQAWAKRRSERTL